MGNGVLVIPGFIILLGSKIMKRADKHKMKLPRSSNRKPNHSFDPLLWKSIRKFAFTLLRLSSQKLPCFLKERMVMTPDILSEKWWITGAFVIESRRVNSRDDARK